MRTTPEDPVSSPTSDEALTLTIEGAEVLISRLEALAQAARVFGSGLADVDVDIGWTLKGGDEEIRWIDPGSDRPRVRVQLDLSRVIAILRSGDADTPDAYLDAFKAGFLHEMGHILYSGQDICSFTERGSDPLACVALDEEYEGLAGHAGVRELLRKICLVLEDARVERRLTQSFRGARRWLEGHPRRVQGIVHAPGGDLDRLVGVLFLQIWGAEEMMDRERVPPAVLDSAERLRGSLGEVAKGESALSLAEWVGRYLVPEIADLLQEHHASGMVGGDTDSKGASPDGSLELDEQPPPERAGESLDGSLDRPLGRGREESIAGAAPVVVGRADDAGSGGLRRAEDLERRFAAPDLLTSGGGHRLVPGDAGGAAPLESRIIAYPHVDGRLVLDELQLGRASKIRPDERTSQVARDVLEVYGPMAENAFASEASALRRAFQVNYERRFAGRYRSGKRVGVTNVRRFVVSEDLRLFQKMEVPDRLSYYFHLLVDVSPSMFANQNAAKAVATAYAFADALDRLRVPVDVTLFSSAVTVLHDHRVDALDRFFGGELGYLSSGTHEIEAISYAKQCADVVTAERKVVVVLTDGRPNSPALRRAGSTDLKAYYGSALIPWLDGGGIDLMAIGIGTSPGYHRDSVSVSSSWESIGVLMRLLDAIIARGEGSHRALWA